MPLNNQITSFQRFDAAAAEVINFPEIEMNVEEINLTVSDLDNPRTSYYSTRMAYSTKKVPATLITITAPSPYRDNRRHAIQAIFTPDEKFVAGHVSTYGVVTAKEVEMFSRRRVSQPFNSRSDSLVKVLKALEDFHPEVRADLKAKLDARLKRQEDYEAKVKQERLEERRAIVIAARAKAVEALGDAATDAVLDYFAPLP